jgi:hypothetical protein
MIVASLMALAVSGSASAASTPTVTYSPTSPSIGDRVTVRGKNFKGRKKCSLKINGVRYASGRTSKKGRVQFAFTVPQDAWQELVVDLTCGGATASTTIVVVDGQQNFSGADSGGGWGIGEDDGSGDDPEFDFSF